MKSVHLHIDRITVDGLSAGEQRQFARALETKLRALAVADGVADGGDRNLGAVNAGVLRRGAGANQAATQVVNAIRARLSSNNKSGQHSGSRGREGGSHV
ncbi:MAG TPA: hypothetical protein VG267_10290 [Terracidiphilus sp.]|jgi:hypothetical protein|nr:hypothetical protein [Terracidiphilus sp.]